MTYLDDDKWRATLLAVLDQARPEGRSGWDEASHPRGPGGKFADVPGLSMHVSKGKRKGISHTTITAKQWDSKVGHIRLTGGGSEIDDLHVDPRHRGKGIANKLMQEAISQFGDQTIRLHASPFGKDGLDSSALQAFYAKHGFVPDPGRGKGYMIRHPRAGRSADWSEELHPRGPDGKFGHSGGLGPDTGLFVSDADALATSVDGGYKSDSLTKLTGGAVALSVYRVKFLDGTDGVIKGSQYKDQSDNEVLSARVGAALGAPVPAAMLDPDASEYDDVPDVYMRLVPGKTLAEHGIALSDPKVQELSNTPEGVLIGLLDALTGNYDRNAGNIIIRPDGRVAGIDHGNADFESFHGNHPATGAPLPPPLSSEPFIGNFVEDNDVLWKSGGLTKADFDDMRPKLSGLRQEFEDMDRAEWFDLMMDRFEAIAKTAEGSGA